MAKTFQTDVILKLVDNLGGPLTRTARSVERSTNMMRRAFRALDRSGAGLVAGFAGLAGVTRLTEKLGRDMVEISRLQNKINAASVGIGQGADGKPITTVLSEEEKGKNIETAIANSKKYNIAVQTFLKANDELVRAGNSPAAARGASEYAAILSKFADMPADKLAESLTAVMVDYKMPRGTEKQIAATTKEIANLLAFAETAAPGKIADLFESLRFSGSMLSSTGTDLKSSVAILIALAKAQIKGSEAGVALRSMMVSLVRPTKKGREELEKMGLSYDDFVTKTQTTGKSLAESLQKYSVGDSTEAAFPAFDMKRHEKALDKVAAIKDVRKRAQALTEFLKKNVSEAATMGADELATLVNENLAVAGTKVDLTKFFEVALNKGIPAEALVKIFEGRQFNRINLAIQHAMDIAAIKAKGIPDNMLETMFGESMKGISGAVDSLEASFTRLAAVLEKSKVGKDIELIIRNLASAITTLSEAFDKFDPDTQRWVAIGAAVLTLAGLSLPILMLARAFGRLATNMTRASVAAAALDAAGGGPGAGPNGGPGGGAKKPGLMSGLGRVLAKATKWALVAAAAKGVYDMLPEVKDMPAPDTGPAGKSASEYIAKRRAAASGEAAGAMNEEAQAAQDLAAKGPQVQTFSSTVTSAMEAISSGVGGAVAQMGSLVSKINEAGQAAQNLKKSSMGFEVLKGIKGASPIGTGGDKSSGLGGGGGGAKLAIDVTSSDGSVSVKSMSGSGNLPVKTAASYRGRRMQEIG